MTPERAIAIAREVARMCKTTPAKVAGRIASTKNNLPVRAEVSAGFYVYVTVGNFEVSTDLEGNVYRVWKITEKGVVDVSIGATEES